MKVFRISRGKYATPLSGEGAAKYGARWNPVGIALIYTAQNRALAMAEVAVHHTYQRTGKSFHIHFLLKILGENL